VYDAKLKKPVDTMYQASKKQSPPQTHY
jgi:hypothetical protein